MFWIDIGTNEPVRCAYNFGALATVYNPQSSRTLFARTGEMRYLQGWSIVDNRDVSFIGTQMVDPYPQKGAGA
jgi:hypothetical protein